ncbi:MAG: hypothetical protein ACD_37C00567G0001 [uncultured bacterium]|nr:MAG: hypothetical protein ACD_37C00567G0001 [uncultured bacterium]
MKTLPQNPQIIKEVIHKASQGELEDWVFSYLTNIDKNPGFVEGLRQQKRWWVGPQDYQLKKLIRTCGPEKNIDFPENKERWELRVEEMVKGLTSEWSAPPIITEYTSEGLFIRDGNHRQEALLQIGTQKYSTIAWFNTLNDLIRTCKIQSHTFFLTGTSGSGKSTIVESIQKLLPFVDVHDFDEGGVPEGADEKWRIERTNDWLKVAQDNHKKGMSTIICGVSVPSEVNYAPAYSEQLSVHFGVIHTEPDDVRGRLKKRGWNDSLIENNITWAQHLEQFVKAEPDNFLVDSSKYNPDQVTEKICNWIINKIVFLK